MATRLDVVISTARVFAAQAGALRVMVLLDRGPDDGPALVDCMPGQGTDVTEGSVVTAVPEDSGRDVGPLTLPAVKRLPPMEVDATAGEIAGPLGSMAHLAGAVRDLATQFGGRSVLTVQFATTDPEAPLSIAARDGEPLVLALGEEQFPMPAGWP